MIVRTREIKLPLPAGGVDGRTVKQYGVLPGSQRLLRGRANTPLESDMFQLVCGRTDGVPGFECTFYPPVELAKR